MTVKKYLITAGDVVDDLTSDLPNAPLSAKQGKVLKEIIDSGTTPTTHAFSHATGGTDPITLQSIGAEPAFSKNTAFNKSFGTAAGTVCEGNDARLMTDAERTKLSGIDEGAEVNVIDTIKVNNVEQTVTSKAVNIPMPTTVTELSDSGNYALKTDVTSAVSTHNGNSSAHPAIRQSVADELNRAEGVEQSLQNQIDALTSRTDVVDVVATYADLDITKYLVNDIVKVMQDETHSNAISYYKVVETGGVKSWSYLGSQGPFYTKSEADGYFVPQQRTINGQALTGNVVLDAGDVGAASTAHTHAAGDVTSGTFSADRIPSLTKSKISDFPTSMTPTAHASTATTYGVASASNYGHPKASSSTPAKDGTGAVGTDNGLYARADHVHPTQILFGTTEPTASDGAVGDIHIQYE